MRGIHHDPKKNTNQISVRKTHMRRFSESHSFIYPKERLSNSKHQLNKHRPVLTYEEQFLHMHVPKLATCQSTLVVPDSDDPSDERARFQARLRCEFSASSTNYSPERYIAVITCIPDEHCSYKDATPSELLSYADCSN